MSQKNKIRVLIVDDSPAMVKILTKIFESDPEIEVVGFATDGHVAVEEAKRLKPDVITMDYMMPNMNGAETTRAILSDPKLTPAIIVFSAYTKESSAMAFECLRAGAADIVIKSLDDIFDYDNSNNNSLLEKVKVLARNGTVQKHETNSTNKTNKKIKPLSLANRVIVIGASTGGPPVVEDIVTKLPADFKSPVIVIQHIPKFFTKSFAERLNSMGKVPVKEATDNDELLSGHVYVAPGDFHLGFSDENHISIKTTPEGMDFCPSIDVAMESAAKQFGEKCIGIELTGMGNDGSQGAKEIKKAGGYVIAQEPSSCVVGSMPESIISMGNVDEILHPEEILSRIINLSK